MSELSDADIQQLQQKLKEDLESFPDSMKSLETELESAAKHIPAYIKIVKSHIGQLEDVLKLDNHNHRTLETAGLAEPVKQLINLFRQLQDDDIQLLEALSAAAKNWQPEYAESSDAIADSEDASILESSDAETTSEV